MSDARPIDAKWRQEHPLPSVTGGLDKEARGRVLVVGGSRLVPGAVRLTAEAALRTGAGKVQVGTIEDAAVVLGVAVPEIAVIGLPEQDGEIAPDAAEPLNAHLDFCQTLVLGCGMSKRPHTAELVARLLAALEDGAHAVIDGGALSAAGDGDCEAAIRRVGDRVVLTPHPGELAGLMGIDAKEIERDLEAAARAASRRFGAVVALKSETTIVAEPGGALLSFISDSPGLGTAGSGDVLAGVIGALLARGAKSVDAAGWGVWLHGHAGTTASARIGPTGFLARELPAFIPAVMAAQSQR